ncbi:MAG TPA: nitroreductase family protein [Steroidobacteraceae bacterium]|nr:nitroreductase family protein [Steroidobacteraceae bacterium]
MQAIDLLLTRRSARALTEPAPDAAALDLILASAARAPDHGRLRPWRFLLVRGQARLRFGALLAAHLRREHPGTDEQTLERERAKALRAPLIVVVAAHLDAAVKIPAVEQLLACAAAAEAMMLASVALGFGAMWKTGAAAYDAQVRVALGFAPTDAIVGFLYLGTEVSSGPAVAPAEWRDLVREFAPPG